MSQCRAFFVGNADFMHLSSSSFIPYFNFRIFDFFFCCHGKSNIPVVSQFYDTDVNKAYVIRGNAAILKCEIPSFVADFVSVVSWHTDQEDETFYPANDYGLFYTIKQHNRNKK